MGLKLSLPKMEIFGGLLNKDGFESFVAHYLNQWMGTPIINFEPTEKELGPKRLEEAEAAALAHLRDLVNRWIQSGKAEDDGLSETPGERTLTQIVPGYEGTLSDVIKDYDLRNKYHLAIFRGRAPVLLHPQPRLNVEDPGFYGREVAVQAFIDLLNSKTSARLARCTKCEEYFTYKRSPKGTIKRGSFCNLCKGELSSRRTTSSRARRKDDLVRQAAMHWTSWKATRRFGKRSEWISKQVNRTIKKTISPITGKWVTQNEQAIVAEVARRDHHAKS